MKSTAQIIESDRQRSAYHEAGHAVVALALGLPEAKLMMKARTPVDPTEEYYWEARVFCDHHLLKAFHKAVLGYAGWTAEWMLEEYLREGSIPKSAESQEGERYQFFNENSDSDISLVESVNEALYGRAVVRAHGILVKHWKSVARVARALIESKDGKYVATPDDL